MAMSSGDVNTTELVAALINQQDDFVSGIKHRARKPSKVRSRCCVMTSDGQHHRGARQDGSPCQCSSARTTDGYCVSFESFAYHKLGYDDAYELGPGEIVRVDADGIETLVPCRRAR